MFLLCLSARQARLVSEVYRCNSKYTRKYLGSLIDCNMHKSKMDSLQYQAGNTNINCGRDFASSFRQSSLDIKQCHCELPVAQNKKDINNCTIHNNDISLTPYSFSDNNSKEFSTVELQNWVSSQNMQTIHSLEQFLLLYNAKYGNSKTTVKTNRELNREDNVQQTTPTSSLTPPTGNELDNIFGVENIANNANVAGNSDTKDDNFLYVTEMLNNYLLSAGERLSSIFVVEKGENSVDYTGHSVSSSNEYLHNIENPLEAYSQSLLAADGNVYSQTDFNVLNYDPSATRDDINKGIEKSKHLVSSPDIVYFSTPENNSSKNVQSSEDSDCPTKDQLLNLQDFVVDMVPDILSKMHEYKIYKPDLIFENNWVAEPYVSHGLVSYSLQLLKLRWKVNIRYANVRVSVLKSTIHEEEGSVKIRWRMSGLPQGRVLQFWKFLPWNYRKNLNQESVYHDGLSTLYVASSGHIYKHQVDRVIPDDEVAAVIEEDKKVNLVEKLKKIATPPAPAPTLTR